MINETNNNNKNTQPPNEGSNNAFQAHRQADKDIAKDPEMSIHSKNDDLDEGELARLGGDNNDLT